MRKNLVILIILCLGALSFGNEINILNKVYIGDQIEDFNIDLVNGDIHIIPSEDNKFRIEMVSKDKIRYIEKKDINSHKYNIEIKSLKKKTLFNKEGKIDVSISIPINDSKNINIDTVNSKMDVVSVKANLNINLINGEINIKNLDGNLSVEAVNAPIYLDGITGISKIETVNGKIEGKKINKIGDIETVKGPINIEGNELLERAQLGSVTGNIKLRVKKFCGENNISTITGEVSLNVKNTKDIKKYDDVYSLDGKNIIIEAMIGKIKIND